MGKVCTTCGGDIAEPKLAEEMEEKCVNCAPEEAAPEAEASEAPTEEAAPEAEASEAPTEEAAPEAEASETPAA